MRGEPEWTRRGWAMKRERVGGWAMRLEPEWIRRGWAMKHEQVGGWAMRLEPVWIRWDWAKRLEPERTRRGSDCGLCDCRSEAQIRCDAKSTVGLKNLTGEILDIRLCGFIWKYVKYATTWDINGVDRRSMDLNKIPRSVINLTNLQMIHLQRHRDHHPPSHRYKPRRYKGRKRKSCQAHKMSRVNWHA